MIKLNTFLIQASCMNNVLVTGVKGQLGSEIKNLIGNYPIFNFHLTDINKLDITNPECVKEFINNHKINYIINCAAYTAVDLAENEEKLAFNINHKAVESLARIAKSKKIKLIHISTDYVFDGKSIRPYNEDDIPNPKSVYGFSKLAGEQAIKSVNPINSIIIRTSWVYSRFGNNFVKTMLKLSKSNSEIKVVSDQIGTPTNAFDLAKVILDILPKIKNNNVQIFHFSNNGQCSWLEFADLIFKLKNIKLKLIPIKTDEYPTIAKRPSYSVLDKTLIKNTFNLKIPNWEESLTNTINYL